jgi:hypothetical protein
MSIKFTDTQLIALSAAARREDRCLVMPEKLKGLAARKFADKLVAHGVVKEINAKPGTPVWRRDEETGRSYSLKLTAAGLKVIAVEEKEEEETGLSAEAAAAVAITDTSRSASISETPPMDSPNSHAPRGGTKLAEVIDLLMRDGGATLADLVAATDWLPHTTRAALTGLRKRGYPVTLDRSDKARGSVYGIATGRAA